MLVFGTQIHVVTFIFIILEICMAIFQIALYLIRPKDNNRRLYLIMLALMLFYNITGGLFPDNKIAIPLSVQEMIAYGSGFLMASFFPYYFYKAFSLPALRWHALYGVPLFLVLPYILFFVIIYAINGDLQKDMTYGLIIPFLYALVLLWAMFSAIWKKNRQERNRDQLIKETAMYLAISPWAWLTVSGFIEQTQLVEVICTNTGIIAITFLFIYRSVMKSRKEYLELQLAIKDHNGIDVFTANCIYFKLTKTETAIAQAACTGSTNRQIADALFISEETVKKHISNIYRKTAVRNRTGLSHKLNGASIVV